MEGKVRRNWPPMGTELVRVAPRLMGPEFTRPGIWSCVLEKASGLPTVTPPPRESVAPVAARGKSVEVSTWNVPAFCPVPIVTAPATNVKVCAAAVTIAPAVVHTTVALGLNAIAVMPVVAQPATEGFVTRVTVKVVRVFFKVMELSDAKVRVSTLLARAAVTFPEVVDAQFALQAAALEASNENPARGIATWVTPVTMDGIMFTVSVLCALTVVVAGLMVAGTWVWATFASAHLAVAEAPTVLSFVASTLEK